MVFMGGVVKIIAIGQQWDHIFVMKKVSVIVGQYRNNRWAEKQQNILWFSWGVKIIAVGSQICNEKNGQHGQYTYMVSIGGQREGAEHLMVFMGGKNNISRPAVGSQICIEINVPTLEGFNYSAVCYFCFPTVNMTVLIAEGIGRGSVIICFHNSGTTGLGWIFSEQSIGEMGWVIPKKWPCPTRARPFLRNHLASTMVDL